MSAAAPMAATVATAKIVLRIIEVSPRFLLDVISHPARLSGERSVRSTARRICGSQSTIW
jgi:hypothetical protein